MGLRALSPGSGGRTSYVHDTVIFWEATRSMGSSDTRDTTQLVMYIFGRHSVDLPSGSSYRDTGSMLFESTTSHALSELWRPKGGHIP